METEIIEIETDIKTIEELNESVEKAKINENIENNEIQDRFEIEDEFYNECINDPNVEIIEDVEVD